MNGLRGKKIGVAASRNRDAIAKLIKTNGGEPIHFPIQGEQRLNDNVSCKDVQKFIDEAFDDVLLTTGIGAETLGKAASDLNCHSAFIEKLKDVSLAVRGSKTVNWLKQQSIVADLVSEDGTMDNLLGQLGDGNGRRLFLQAYSQEDVAVKSQLERQGYAVYLARPYQYREPDPDVLAGLGEQIKSQSLDVVVFTSKTQVRNLFNESGGAEIASAFNDSVLSAAVGKVTAAELEKNGVTTVFQPKTQKMGVMIIELSRDMGTGSLSPASMRHE
ncbi:uroporphyrinogen-III synthase [Lentibacillus persicus]|uniref:Uroporphyrinogen-III synthase n=1 Tax=Lentibacillus persicus TaxID=640948 RepID=A0A1I1WA72_9BACI|nr:uroporphyrinogen-III synthase [Lentibacillus persicus]SFD89930.1 uroporphyrinogen-III synthase [Lentibacillus persicus]